MHRTHKMLWWTWGATVALFLAVMALSLAPLAGMEEEAEAKLSPTAERFAAADGFEEVSDLIIGSCSMCHTPEPYVEGLAVAPKGVRLDNPSWVATHAQGIYLQAGVSHAMPPGIYNYLSDEDRAVIVAWYRAAKP